MRRFALVTIVGIWVVGMPACNGDACTDTQVETADGACEPGTSDTDTDAGADTDTTVDPSDAGTLTANVIPGAGDPYTFVASSVSGGFFETDLWAFTAIGPVPSDFLAFEFAGAPGLGTYTIGTAGNPNFSLYSDVTNLGTGSVLGSLSGSMTISRWDYTEWELGEAYVADGTFEIVLSDGQDPTPLLLDMTGDFADVWMEGDAYQSR